MFNFDEIIDRRHSDSGKWNVYDADVLPLWVADTDFKSPDVIMDAIKQRVDHGVFGYPTHSNTLAQTTADWVEKRHGWKINPEQVQLLTGVISGFNLVAQAFAGQGKVLVQIPSYPPFLHVAENAGTQMITHSLVPGVDQYEMDFDSFEAAASQASIFLLCNPQNPTGRVFTRAELERMAEICLRHHVLICSDEIHSDLVYGGQKHIPIASLSPEVAARTITLIAPSKTFNVAGLKTAMAILPSKDMIKPLSAAAKGLVGSPNLLGQTAAEAAYRHGEAWLAELLVYLEANRDFMVDFIHRNLPGINCFSPQGTYLAWLDCRALNLPGTPYQFFLDKARVALNKGDDFGENGIGFVRINFACPRATLLEALQRMFDVLSREGYLHSK